MELVILSGKGGTGKTTIATALSELAKDVVRVDCDVDASNLYLFYKGKDIKKEDFYGEKKAIIDYTLCIKCGKCESYCKFDAIENCNINPYKCEGCGACTLVCPKEAITLEEEKSAEVIISKMDKGIISRAEMEIGSEGSGLLIAQLKKNSREFTNKEDIIIVDGSPGIGCSIISSITGANLALIVTEPTMSAMEDFIRVKELCEYFKIPMLVCINKCDINEEVAEKIYDLCTKGNIEVVGKIPYDDTVINSINELKPIIYYEDSKANKAIRAMWNNIKNYINNLKQNK